MDVLFTLQAIAILLSPLCLCAHDARVANAFTAAPDASAAAVRRTFV